MPDEALRVLIEHPDEIPVGLTTRATAVVLFTDIAGFTAMSEALAKVGSYGAEELSRILNSYFDSMIGQATKYGGTVSSLTGDALTVLFPCNPSVGSAASRLAVQSALDMQAAMAAFQAVDTQAGQFRLGMRAGLAKGSVSGMILGHPDVRLEYVVTGRAIARAAAMEQRAASGQVVVDSALVSGDDRVDTIDLGGGACLVERIRTPPQVASVPPANGVDQETTSRLARFLHPAIAERLRAGRRGLVNEHRKVTVAFVSVPGVSGDGAEGVTDLQAYIAAAVRVVDRYGGYLNQVDTGDKGNLLMLCFGTPVSHEDDEERAVRCCLELVRLPSGPFRAGITTGLVFCGAVGSDRRRYYTVVGLSVNLAARLLQAAQPGQILIDAATYEQVKDTAVSDRLQPITVKGKTGPLTVWAVRAARERPGLRLLEPLAVGPLIGRDAELHTIGTIAGHAYSGHGQVASISGAAGIGKSRLVAETVAIGERLGFAVYGGACQSYGRTTAYLVWRPILRGLLGVNPDVDFEQQRLQVLERMTAYGMEWRQRAPLLAPLLGLPIDDSNLTDSLDAKTRAELLQSLVTSLLRLRATDGPLLLVLEDCHWIDPSSTALLDMVARNIGDLPLLLVLAARREDSGPSPVASLASLPHLTEIRLEELPASATRRLVATRLRAVYGQSVDLAAAVTQTVEERAGGNPFHVEQLIAYLHSRGVDLSDASGLAVLELPDSLHRLLQARLDQLTEGEMAAVKVASVIGRVFRPEWLWGSYPEVGSPEEVMRHLEHLDALGITPRHSASSEVEYGFKHAMIQEVAYDGLPFGMRQTLHEAVGVYIEQAYAGRLDPFVDLLAFHYGRTRNEDKQRVWFRAAGVAAKAGYANDTAIEHFERLLPLLPAEQSADVLLQLGEIWHLIGRWSAAEDAYRRALEIARRHNDGPLLAAGKRNLGSLLMRTSSYADGVAWLVEAVKELEQLDDRKGLAAALDRLAFAAIQQGAHADAAAAAQRHLAIATEVGDQREASGALHNLGLVAWDAGRRDEALELLGQALAAAAAAGEERSRARIANDLAALHVERGDHALTMNYLAEAAAIAQRIGDQWLVALCTGNAAELYAQRGDYSRAVRYAAHALRLAIGLGDWVHMTSNVGRFAAIAVATGKFAQADKLYRRATALARLLGDAFTLHEYLHEYAKLLAATGRLEEAEDLNQQVLKATAEADAHMWLHAELLSTRLQVTLGRLDRTGAVERLEALIDTFTETGEQAAILDTIATVDPVQKTASARAATLYRECYDRAPTVEVRQAYARLTGAQLPAGPALPPLLEPVEADPSDPDVEALLTRVQANADALNRNAASLAGLDGQ